MFRLVVGVLAAFVGFSFGHSIPKWMESNKTKSATEFQSPSCAHPVRKLLLRRKSLRKFKFGSQKPGKENLEIEQSLQQLSKDIAEDSNGPLKCLPNSSLCTSAPNSSLITGARVRAQHKKLRFGSKKELKENLNNVSSLKGLDSNPDLPLSAVNVEKGSRLRQNASANFENGCCPLHDASANIGKGHRSPQTRCEKSKIGHQNLHIDDGLPAKSKLEEPVFCKISSSTQSACESPMKEKSQMKQWKMKLMSLRSKAMASEKVWYEKFEKNEKQGRNYPAPSSLKGSMKKQVKGKENESPQWASAKNRDVPWSRSSTAKVGLLVEGPISAFER